MTWLTDWRDADIAERDRQDRLADWRREMEQEAREQGWYVAMVERQLD